MNTYNQIIPNTQPGLHTNIPELDSFVSNSGGFEPESVIFFTGTSGAAKTTLCKLIQRNMSETKTALLQRETSSASMAQQLQRIEINHGNAFVEDSLTVQNFLIQTEQNGVKLLFIDSLQACQPDFPGLSIDQAAKEVYKLLRAWCKVTGGVAIIIGQVNKDGSFSNKNTIKHMADAHFEMMFDPKKNLRYMISTKNRMGGTVGSPLFYRFTETHDILEFNTVRFTEKNIDILDQCIECVRTYLQRLKRTDPTLFKQVHPKVIRISYLSIPDVEMLSRIISCIHTMESARNMKKVA